MAGSDEQHDEQPAAASPADAMRDAVERTLRDAAGALQRFAGPADDGALAELTARVDALAARVEALEKRPKPARSKPAKSAKAATS